VFEIAKAGQQVPSPADLPRQPLAVHLYVTPRCNLSCPHCYYDAFERTKHPRNLISLEQIDDVLTGLVQRFEADIHLEGGEPFIRRGIDSLLDRLDSNVLGSVTVTTNGTIKLRTSSEALRQLDLLRISVDGHTAELQDEMRGADLAKVMNTCAELGGRDVPFMVRMTLWRKNVRSLREIYAWAESHGIARLSLYEFQPSGRGADVDDRFSVSDAEIDTFLSDLEELPQPRCLTRLTLHLAERRLAALNDHRAGLEEAGFRVRELGSVANCTINYDGTVGISPWRVTAHGAPDVFTTIDSPGFWEILTDATDSGSLADASPCISKAVVEWDRGG
jgi:MoaA/NifB/PqqE/SkfB family radical SAM enzyme